MKAWSLVRSGVVPELEGREGKIKGGGTWGCRKARLHRGWRGTRRVRQRAAEGNAALPLERGP